MQHFLYFLPLPQGHGSLRRVLGVPHWNELREPAGPLFQGPFKAALMEMMFTRWN
jgi:hypothetical protein